MSWSEGIGLVALVIVSGGFTTVIVQVITRVSWKTWIKQAVTIAVAACFGLATAWLAGDVMGLVHSWGELTAASLWAFVASVYTTANIWYKSVIQATGILKKKGSS